MLSVTVTCTILLKCVKLHVCILVLNKFTKAVRIRFLVNFNNKQQQQQQSLFRKPLLMTFPWKKLLVVTANMSAKLKSNGRVF